MHIVKDLPNELQDTYSLSFLYNYVCTSCKQTRSTKIISFKTSHSFLMFKFTDVISNFIWCACFILMIIDLSPLLPCNNIYYVHAPSKYVIHIHLNTQCVLLEHNISQDRGNLLNICDFNIHMDDVNHPDTITFTDFLQSFSLVNTAGFQTHKSKHILDLIITDNLIIN